MPEYDPWTPSMSRPIPPPRPRDSRGRFIPRSTAEPVAATDTSGWAHLLGTTVEVTMPDVTDMWRLPSADTHSVSSESDRRTVPLAAGDRVQIDVNPSSDGNGGFVQPQFSGRIGTIVGENSSHTAEVYRVELEDADDAFVDRTNYIHRSSLMLIGDAGLSAPESPAPVYQSFLPGDTVHTSQHPRTRANRGMVSARFADRDLIVVEAYDDDDVYTVQSPHDEFDRTYIHAHHLTLVNRPAPPPVLQIGQFVRINTPAYMDGLGNRRINTSFEGVLGTVNSVRGEQRYPGVYQVRNRAQQGVWVHSRYLTTVTREEFDAALICHNSYCGREVDSEDDRVVVHTAGGPDSGCSACTTTCDECGETGANAWTSYYPVRGRDGRFCVDCTDFCSECSQHYLTEEYADCPDADEHPEERGVRGYGHTTASMWLGGPLPKNEKGLIDTTKPGAYYLGIELEITADEDESAMPIYRWAKEHLGSSEAIQCKEDSSLDEGGFEIVTMPMTPQLFESVDWESFFDLINTNHPSQRSDGGEPSHHGLHVHIGRVAFERDDVATAAYTYLLSQGDHLDRIARREPYHYCAKVRKPVSTAIAAAAGRTGNHNVQSMKIDRRGIYPGRDAINLQNTQTIEIRAFRSTRSANELRDAVRVTYIAAEYIKSLRMGKRAVSPRALHWSMFAKWVGTHYPEAFPSIAGIPLKDSNRGELVGAAAGLSINTEF